MTIEQLKLKSNPISDLIEIQNQIKALKKIETALKDQISNLCDLNQTDKIAIDDYIASRELQVRSNVDTKAVKEILGDKTPTKEVEVIKWSFK